MSTTEILDTENASMDDQRMLAIGTAKIPESLKRKSILCLYRDGTWTTGENVKEGWIVMVDVPRVLAVCVQEFHGKFRFTDGYYWHQCDEAASGDWLLVNYIFSVYFGNKTALTDDDEVIGRIYLTNYAYIDNNGNIEVAI
jgi:hypothetical protein